MDEQEAQQAREIVRRAGKVGWLLVLAALLTEVTPAGRLRVRTVTWLGAASIAAGAGFVGWQWGWHTLQLAFIALFWLGVIVIIISALRGERKQREAAAGRLLLEPYWRKLLRGFSGCAIALVGFILTLAAAIPTVALQPKINPGDTLWGNALLFVLFALPGVFVMAAGCGLLFTERSNKPATDWKTTRTELFHLIRRTGYISAPIVFVALIFMWVMDRVRFRPGEEKHSG